MHKNEKPVRSGECESNSAPISNNLRLLTAKFINLAHKKFKFLKLKRGAELKTLHASPIKNLMSLRLN